MTSSLVEVSWHFDSQDPIVITFIPLILALKVEFCRKELLMSMSEYYVYQRPLILSNKSFCVWKSFFKHHQIEKVSINNVNPETFGIQIAVVIFPLRFFIYLILNFADGGRKIIQFSLTKLRSNAISRLTYFKIR